MHQIYSTSHKDLTIFQFHNISCFCVTYIDRILDERCDNELLVHPWSLKRLKPCNSLEVKNMMIDPNEEINNGKGGEWIVGVVCVGDTIVLVADNENGEQF
jgi:hypothetical protein